MKRFEVLLSGFCLMAAFVAIAATGSSPEFKVDLRGLGPWQRRTAAASEALTHSSAWATNAASGAKAVVKVMPVLKTKPKYLVIDLSGGTNATSYGISYLDEVPGGKWSDEYKTSKLVLRHIPAGSFIMGGRATDYPGAVNTNLHMVTITRDFYMGVFEVTQRQWELVMGNRPSVFSNETCYATRPVERVSWTSIRGADNECQWPRSKEVNEDSFLGRLRKKAMINGIDLPTDAQWEYACRAGTTTALNTGVDLDAASSSDPKLAIVARYSINSGYDDGSYPFNGDDGQGTARVGTYMPNAYGLYDMHGNVWEWTLDWFKELCTGCIDPVGELSATYKVTRGGGWQSAYWKLIAGHRDIDDVDRKSLIVGFRLCLQGGDIPDLTHSTMNGTTNVQLASAWFEVLGCTLTLEPHGELTNGVMIAITGADEGWTVYYTTNGLAPSKASEPYIGPFTLPGSGTVRAVALSPGTHRLTWNADADIAADGEFPRVAVTVKTTRQSVVAAYARSLAISTDVYAGSETLTNVPVLVRLSTTIARITIPDAEHNWVALTFSYSGDKVSCYTNGVQLAVCDIVAASDNGSPLGIGGWPNGVEGSSLNGQYDEIRLRGGSLSADRIKADYDMIANRKFCTYGAVKKGAE